MKHPMPWRMLAAVAALASAAVVVTSAQPRTIPRTPDGKPDLQGMYDLAMLTPLERPAGLPAVLTDQEAAKLEKQAADTAQAGALPIDGDRSAPPKGGDGSGGPAGQVGGDKNFWRH